MSSYGQKYSQALTSGVTREGVDPGFAEEFPHLAEIFRGVPKNGEGSFDVAPATLNLFWEGGVLKFCIIPRTGNRVAFGSCQCPEKGLQSVEEALAAEHFEWKISKRRSSP
jgi:hypothetical protein